jgi:hypothetical protein
MMAANTGLPLESLIALALLVLAPVATYLLYRIDTRRADGYVSVLGRR